MSIAVDKKSKRGRPRADTDLVTGRVPRSTLDVVDAWIATHPDPQPTRSDVMRAAMQEWAERQETRQPQATPIA